MDKLVIEGGRTLKGTVAVSGSKNAALPILLATLLTDEACVIERVPDLRDIRTTAALLEFLGKRVVRRGDAVEVQARRRLRLDAPYDLVKQMRASVLVAGPLLARFHRVRVPLPGGCAIGMRPIDLHLSGFERLGGAVSQRGGVVGVRARGPLRGARITFRFPSVGATENVLMAAVLAQGTTVIENAAHEPEIADLAAFLRKMGAKIEGAGTHTIRVKGVRRLAGAVHAVIPDRIEAGTYLIACAAAGGALRLTGAEPAHLSALLAHLKKAGCRLRVEGADIEIRAPRRPAAVDVATRPYPGFPTDLQAPWMALMAVARGDSNIQEKIFEKRFLHAAELARMGAHLLVEDRRVLVKGGRLSGAPVMASDLRAGAALMVAGLAAPGRTVIERVYHIDRGYERVEEKLRALGARIERVH